MNFIKKWYTYQKERFPIAVFGIYILTIVLAVFAFANFNNKEYEINYISIIPMFFVAFLQFLMVRIIDEFKDYEEDCKYRPYRPVPRGLITLKELKILFIICIILQFTITLLFTKNIITIMSLIILWLFFFIMTKGFFIKKLLDNHILLEVSLDELMMPIMVIFLFGFTPFVTSSNYNLENSFIFFIEIIQNGWKFLLLTYLVSWIVEIARKIRCKEDEENGVKTYTAVFGILKATLLLSILEILISIIQYTILEINYIFLIILMCVIVNILFVIKKSKKFAKIVELSANIYIMLVYLSMLLLII